MIKNHPYNTQTTFSENNKYYRGIIGEKEKKIIDKNASFQGYFRGVFRHLKREPAVIFSK